MFGLNLELVWFYHAAPYRSQFLKVLLYLIAFILKLNLLQLPVPILKIRNSREVAAYSSACNGILHS